MLFPRDYFLALGLLFVLILVLFVAELFRNQTKPLENLAFSMFGITYLAIPLGLIISASFDSEGNYQPWYILFFFFFMWASDTGAYFAGRFFGKRKLFERLSPKKTIEGFIGAIVLTALVAFVLSRFWDDISTRDWMLISVIVVVFGTLGDLVESLLKRNLGIKDSGAILPGHGGVLDRFDGVFISAPAVYFYLLLSN